MNQDNKKPSINNFDSKSNNMQFILATFASTTLRMFIPVAIGVVGGVWVDNNLHTQYSAISGSLFGLSASIALVWDQYKKATKKNNKDLK